MDNSFNGLLKECQSYENGVTQSGGRERPVSKNILRNWSDVNRIALNPTSRSETISRLSVFEQCASLSHLILNIKTCKKKRLIQRDFLDTHLKWTIYSVKWVGNLVLSVKGYRPATVCQCNP